MLANVIFIIFDEIIMIIIAIIVVNVINVGGLVSSTCGTPKKMATTIK